MCRRTSRSCDKHGKRSNATTTRPSSGVYEVRDGKIVYGRSYLSRREALKAVGLEE